MSAGNMIGPKLSGLATAGTPFASKWTSFPRNSGPIKATTKILVNAVQKAPNKISAYEFLRG